MKIWQTTDSMIAPEECFRRGWWGIRRYFSVNPWQRYYEYYRNIRCGIQLSQLKAYRRQVSLLGNGAEKNDRALVLANFEARDGLSRGAHYTIPAIRKRHVHVTLRHVSVRGNDHKTIEGSIAGKFSHVYLLDPPSRYSRLLKQVAPEQIVSAHRTGLWVRETNYVPRFWTSAASFLDEIWTPSKFSKQLIQASSLARPIVVVPHSAIKPSQQGYKTGQWPNLQTNPFKGLAVMDLRGGGGRKNPWAVIAAWKLAFAGNPQCHLLMKVRFSASRSILREELELLIGSDTNITLLDAFLPDEELNALLDEADVFISLHRSEGYGLPVEEALLRGTPVVATDWSATVEFARQYKNYHPVSHRPVSAYYWDKQIPSLRFQWAEADLNCTADQLNSIYADWSPNALEAKAASRRVSTAINAETTSKA